MTFGEKIREARKEAEWITDFIVASGILQVADYLNDTSSYYLVETGGKQLLVKISDDFLITRELANRVDSRKFDFGNHTFKKAAYQLI